MPKGKIVKALILSIFVIPGAGQLYLKRPLAGGLLVGGTLTTLFAFVVHFAMVAWAQAQAQAKMIADPNQLMQATQALSESILLKNQGLITSYITLLLAFYAAGVIEIFWVFFKNSTQIKTNE